MTLAECSSAPWQATPMQQLHADLFPAVDNYIVTPQREYRSIQACVDPRSSGHSMTLAARCCALALAANIDR